MTEWEREREKEEFIRASKLYKPMSSMMASRFTSAKYSDNIDEHVDVPAEEGVSWNEASAYILFTLSLITLLAIFL